MTDTCPACGSPRTRIAFARAGLGFRRCRDCSSLFDPSPPPTAELARVYEGREYFVKASGDTGKGDELWGYPDDYLADRANVEAKFDLVLGHLERYTSPGKLLDVGCGPGFLLTAARDRGWRVVGVDLNAWAVEHARNELDLDARSGPLEEQRFAAGEFDVLTMMDLIEHVPDPDALVAEAARVTRPGGTLAVLTPDAGSRSSRALGARWPEVRRPGEHTVLFSVEGLTRLLARHGFAACGWHSIGKEASLATLAADVSPAAPALTGKLRDWLASRPLGARTVDFDPRTKFCLYARRRPAPERPSRHLPARVPKRPQRLAAVESAILEELEALAAARRFCDWMFEQFAEHVRGAVAEVGAGIGTFSERILAGGAERLLAIEPDADCRRVLEQRLGDDPRVQVAAELLPDAPSLAALAGELDLVVCQNVLEHIGDDAAAVAAMAAALRPGGHLALVVPAGPSLYGPLDDAYGHWRRYAADDLGTLVSESGLEVRSLHPVNALGIPGWWLKNRRPGARIGAGSLRTYETLLAAWRPLERRLRPRSGLSLVCVARRPT